MMLRTAYSKSRKVAVDCSVDDDGVELPSMTRQSEADSCDINNIMKRFKATGLINHFSSKTPTFGDFSNGEDYQSSMNKILAAQRSFDSLPSDLRRRFGNDPASFLDFVSDPNNLDEMVKLGIAEPVGVKAPVSVHVSNMPIDDAPEDEPGPVKKLFHRSRKEQV